MDVEKRIELFRNMADADPDNELAHFSLGKLHCETRSWSDAEASLRRALELNPKHSVAQQLLGEALLGQGKRDEAIRALEDGVRDAHARGEFMPRDKMRAMLEAEGVAPPDLVAAAGPGGAPVEPGAWTCRRCVQARPRLEEAPFQSELGNRIHESICQSCWREWIAMSIKVINEYRLNMAMPEAGEIYDKHLREFLGL